MGASSIYKMTKELCDVFNLDYNIAEHYLSQASFLGKSDLSRIRPKICNLEFLNDYALAYIPFLNAFYIPSSCKDFEKGLAEEVGHFLRTLAVGNLYKRTSSTEIDEFFGFLSYLIISGENDFDFDSMIKIRKKLKKGTSLLKSKIEKLYILNEMSDWSKSSLVNLLKDAKEAFFINLDYLQTIEEHLFGYYLAFEVYKKGYEKFIDRYPRIIYLDDIKVRKKIRSYLGLRNLKILKLFI